MASQTYFSLEHFFLVLFCFVLFCFVFEREGASEQGGRERTRIPGGAKGGKEAGFVFYPKWGLCSPETGLEPT